MTAALREFDQSDWRLFKNTEAEKIPAFAIVEITESSRANNLSVFQVRKPTSGGKLYGINAMADVPQSSESGHGKLTKSIGFVRYSGGTPSPGDEWGPVAGSWDIQSTGTGVKILGQAADGLVRVSLLGGGGDVPRCLGKVTGIAIPPRTGSSPGTPGTGGGDIIKGDGPDTGWENWSQVEIPVGAYVIILDIGGDPVAIVDFC